MTLIPFALVAALAVQDSAPAERQATFLKALQAGKIQEGYAELLRGSHLLDSKDEVANLVAQTEKGLKIYDGIRDVDNLGLTREHKLVAFGSAVVACEKAPLYYYFIWYRPRLDAPWRCQVAWFDDNSRAFFEGRK